MTQLRGVVLIGVLSLCATACLDFNEQYESFCDESGKCVEAPTCVASGEACRASEDCCGEDSCYEGRCQLVGGPSRVQVTPEALIISSGECSGPLHIRINDDRDRLAKISEKISVFITSPRIEIFSDETCSTLAGLVEIAPDDAPEFDVWVRTVEVGADTIDVSVNAAAGEVASRKAFVTMQVGLPKSLVLDGGDLLGSTGQCLGPLEFTLEGVSPSQ